ncbi:alpha/beta hydrolase [Glycomyces sp. TRM65418]|uniref:alpha/beta fold hydrolase n=1 Tax=Glycomyces sp. TRM65418 TaxID=2867006 RepID=UPI001CE5FBC0|nr:alpha/beta hydrolase [Glycomyces sp. TRM65418]MCC3764791.1 alpha/beta hydrolase [Glycomyces sp. TRM65418]QZD54444.1 alpha/beta hydrolase [Glycomyces sp. TRM65418]
MPAITVGPARIHYRVTGAGPRLVLVHGTGSGGADLAWGDLLDHFAATRTVVLPELSGSLKAEDDGAPLTVEGLADQVAAVIEATGPGPVDVAGFSLGGTVVAALAALRPDLVHRVVPIAGWARSDHPALQQTFELWRSLADDPERFAKFATLTAFSSTFLGPLDADTMAAVNAGMIPDEGTLRQIDLDLRLDIRRLLPDITAPALVIGNAHDACIPVGLTRELADGIAGSRYREFDSGHITFAEQREAFLAAVDAFLD